MRAYETVLAIAINYIKQEKQYLEDLFIIGDRKIGNREEGEWIFFIIMLVRMIDEWGKALDENKLFGSG